MHRWVIVWAGVEGLPIGPFLGYAIRLVPIISMFLWYFLWFFVENEFLLPYTVLFACE